VTQDRSERRAGQTRRSRRRAPKPLTLLAVVLGLSIGGEVLLRLEPQLCPRQEQLKIAETTGGFDDFVDDPLLGARARGDVDQVEHTLDYSYRVRLDSLGFANAEPWPDSVEVAVLGNSLLFGPGVGLEGQFTTLMERQLGPGSVLNLGLPGGSPIQELRIYSKYAAPRHPRIVIATLWVASDVDNAVQFSHWLSEGSPPGFTAYRMDYPTTHGSFTFLLRVRDLLSRSYLLRAAYYYARSLVRPDSLTGRVRFENGQEVWLSVREERRLARGAQRPGLDVADFIAPLLELRARADSAGTRFVVALLPSKEEVYGASTDPDVLNTVREVRTALDAADLPVVDVYPPFRSEGLGRPLFYRRDIHFNQDGNALVARTLLRWIARHAPLETPRDTRTAREAGAPR